MGRSEVAFTLWKGRPEESPPKSDSRAPSQWAAELAASPHGTGLKDMKHIPVMGYAIFFQEKGEWLRPGTAWQGSPCMKVRKGHCVKLWKWSLDCAENSKMLEVMETWDIFQGEMPTGSRTIPREKYAAGSKDERTEPFQPSTPKQNHRIWSLLLWVSVLLWYSIPLLCHNVSLTEWQFIYCATVCWKYVICFWFCRC